MQLLNSFNHEIGQFVSTIIVIHVVFPKFFLLNTRFLLFKSPVINEKNEEFDRIVKEYKQMSEQLSERDKEIEKVRASVSYNVFYKMF